VKTLMSETKSKYKVGFVLQEARCLNCNFFFNKSDLDKYDFFELKETLFAIVEKEHDKSINSQDSNCPKRELLIRFGNVVREVI
jgi:ADP-heptose:LPS heptosyltransferase